VIGRAVDIAEGSEASFQRSRFREVCFERLVFERLVFERLVFERLIKRPLTKAYRHCRLYLRSTSIIKHRDFWTSRLEQ
jgi:hypothetical protein